MTPSDARPGRHLLDGAFRVVLAEALFPLTGLLTALFLSRRLGPADYGRFSVAAVTTAWVQFAIIALFARVTVKFVTEAADWRPVGMRAVQMHLWFGGGAALLLALLAGPLAALLGEPTLAGRLRLFAIDIPVLVLAGAHQSLLIGTGAYRQRALSRAARWGARLLLIVLFVELGLSVEGAILGCIGASLVELAVARYYIRPAVLGRSGVPARALWGYAVPLFLAALSSQVVRLDVVFLKALGGTAEQAGFYSAAQNLAMIPAYLGFAIAPLLVSTLARLLSAGDAPGARETARNAVRAVILVVPFAGLVAGAAPEIVLLLFGSRFEPAGPLLAWLVFAGVGLILMSTITALLVAAGKPRWTLGVTGPLVPLVVLGHVLLIPRLGPLGAAWVTTGAATLGGAATVIALYRVMRVALPAGTVARSAVLAVAAYGAAAVLPGSGAWVLGKLAAVAGAVVGGYLALGEFSREELRVLRSVVLSRAESASRAGLIP